MFTKTGYVLDADRITETGEYVVDPKGVLYLYSQQFIRK